ncbi:MAG: DUF4276 family protein [Rhodospirillales bacterium]
MSRIQIYMEGGGNDDQTGGLLREGMNVFLGELKDLAVEQDLKWDLICCGSRDTALEDFRDACQENEEDKIIILLVDSEKPVKAGDSPGNHLKPDAKVDLDGIPDDLMHLMVQTMETWIVSDLNALRQYYDEKFVPNKIPQGGNMEVFPKRQVSILLKSATRRTKQGRYHKIHHAKDLLKLIRPSVVRRKCAHCDRFFTTLESLINGPAPA